MNETQRRNEQLVKYIVDKQKMEILQSSDEWSPFVERLLSTIATDIKEILNEDTTSQRYYELRASINTILSVLDSAELIIKRGQIASARKAETEREG